MARYQRVEWHHQVQDEPVVLYSEIDDQGFETRKVDEYRDGRLDYAHAERSTGTTWLSEEALPSIQEIASDSNFTPQEIGKEQFEAVWERATSGHD